MAAHDDVMNINIEINDQELEEYRSEIINGVYENAITRYPYKYKKIYDILRYFRHLTEEIMFNFIKRVVNDGNHDQNVVQELFEHTVINHSHTISVEIIKYLKKSGADVNKYSNVYINKNADDDHRPDLYNNMENKGNTPLCYAALSRDLTLCSILLKCGADPYLINRDGMSLYTNLLCPRVLKNNNRESELMEEIYNGAYYTRYLMKQTKMKIDDVNRLITMSKVSIQDDAMLLDIRNKLKLIYIDSDIDNFRNVLPRYKLARATVLKVINGLY